MNLLQTERISGDAAQIDVHLSAYNAAFDELGLRFRWDRQTLLSLATIEDEAARIVAYIETHHAHLLNAYSAEFLSRAILERKSARCEGAMPGVLVSAPPVEHARPSWQAGGRREAMPFDMALPALAGI